MVEHVQSQLITASQVAREAAVRQGGNGVCYALYGQTKINEPELEQIINAVPLSMADALKRKAYYFVPLAISDQPSRPALPDDMMISAEFTTELGDRATCHRNVDFGTSEGVFISARLMHDRFALAFEFFINVGHAFVDKAGVPESFSELVWKQALADTRGETSQDAHESRKLARTNNDEKARKDFTEFAFADAIAIYLLSLSIDFDYAELREREYPLLAAPALAERLKLVASLFPPNPGYEFVIKYRRR
ncbi:hypothetical protein [Terriglobus tenax]|uniref:hypothetical protein n=1 Tax=Terriglobus tenax TaxID=1111115 RepID=UPI0021E0BA9B|nr:hypothetical protein [Terriglobus tenax]